MIRHFTFLVVTLALWGCGDNSTPAPETAPEPDNAAEQTLMPHIVPAPQDIRMVGKQLMFGNEVNLVVDSGAPDSAAAVKALLESLNIRHSDDADTIVQLLLDSRVDRGDEGYEMMITDDIIVRAPTDTGLFYAVQTLRQLLPATEQKAYLLPWMMIADEPQYEWRGSMVDVARNFFELEYLKTHIERMALFKLNRLHLHLSDDQGWRFEVKSWPKLTEVGGSSAIDGNDGGFYTQEQMRELVEFAARHQVEVVPEIDLPGHTQAAIASYNELACDDVVTSPVQNNCEDAAGEARLELYEGTCVGFSALCASEKPDLVYGFVEDVLREVADVFPFEYLHIGGDEVLNEEADAFPEFITRTDQIVESLDRKLLAWEEASAGDIRSNSLLQFWNDDYDIEPALEQGIHRVLSPCSYAYIDHGNYDGQPDVYTWCRAEGVPLERVYSLVPEDYSQSVGVEAAMWSELVDSEAKADNRLWPRLAATAEISWTRQDGRDYDAFTERLSKLRGHFDAMGIEYYPAPELGWDE